MSELTFLWASQPLKDESPTAPELPEAAGIKIVVG